MQRAAFLDERTKGDPRERNFWRFYRSQWLPVETEEYVMLVFSAALISEQPALFGFDARVW
jgi:hypothetical protein